MTVRRVLISALIVWVVGGCGAVEGVDPSAHPEVTASDATVRLVDETEANLIMYVSNQSFDDREVHLTVAIDGVTVVDGDFYVEDQHNWVSFPLALPSGGHDITADSDSGATLRGSFQVPHGTTRYAVIDHWTEGAADLTWGFYRQPVTFG